jgi:Calcineurin-like phosphoesterase
MRTLVVGDIHGGLRALKQVLQRVEPQQEDTYIFLGDYVDGWSENAQTILFLIQFAKSHQCLFLRGNHDELCHNYLTTGESNPMWLHHGGASTQKNYATLHISEKKEHLLFFESLLNYHIDTENRLYVHAGFTNLQGPQHEYYPNVVYWDRTLWEMACALDPEMNPSERFYPPRLKLFKEIYIGHTPVTRMGEEVPVNRANVWNIDTGAAFKGSLSIIDAETKEVWQSDPVYSLYPDEIGRN